jgi:hypothetical protein
LRSNAVNVDRFHLRKYLGLLNGFAQENKASQWAYETIPPRPGRNEAISTTASISVQELIWPSECFK